jgi:hypothetical protein
MSPRFDRARGLVRFEPVRVRYRAARSGLARTRTSGARQCRQCPPQPPDIRRSRAAAAPDNRRYPQYSGSGVDAIQALPEARLVETPPTNLLVSALSPAQAAGSDVVVEVELPRVGAQADLVDLTQPLEREPGLDQIRREDAPGQEVVLVRLQRGQSLLE